jgi:glutathione peroxidase
MSVYGFSLTTIEGVAAPLSKFEGKVLLVVNVASACGFTRQYSGLEALHEKYAERGLVVMGVPSNDFGAQEPGSEAEIQEFCTTKYAVTFPLFSKTGVKKKTHPLYGFLQSEKGAVEWNFTKFLIGRDGEVIDKFESDVKPESKQLIQAIEAALA